MYSMSDPALMLIKSLSDRMRNHYLLPYIVGTMSQWNQKEKKTESAKPLYIISGEAIQVETKRKSTDIETITQSIYQNNLYRQKCVLCMVLKNNSIWISISALQKDLNVIWSIKILENDKFL